MRPPGDRSARPAGPSAGPATAIGRWVETHDDRWSFTLGYVALALLLSTTISLFWLAAVLAAHMALEWWARRRRGDPDHPLPAVVWHVKLDIALLLFALALALYFDVLFGLLGIGALARAGTHATARFVAWQRGLRSLLLAADDVALVAKAAARRRGEATPSDAPGTEEAERDEPRGTSRGDVVTVALALAFLLLILAAPVLTDRDLAGVIDVLASELHPWPR